MRITATIVVVLDESKTDLEMVLDDDLTEAMWDVADEALYQVLSAHFEIQELTIEDVR